MVKRVLGAQSAQFLPPFLVSLVCFSFYLGAFPEFVEKTKTKKFFVEVQYSW